MKHDEIIALANLAHININDDMVAEVADNISNILDLANALQQVNTDGIVPMSHPFDAVQTLRADTVTESNQREALQANAPAVEKGLFLVPQVIE